MVRKIILALMVGVFSIIAVFAFGNLFYHLIERKIKDINYGDLKEYCHKQKLSKNYAIVVDFSKPSGKHRFFICDLRKQTIIGSISAWRKVTAMRKKRDFDSFGQADFDVSLGDVSVLFANGQKNK